jgi:hypothetical protein
MTFYYFSVSFLIGYLATSFPGWIMSWPLRREHWFAQIHYYSYPVILIFTIIHIIKGGE